MALKVRCPSCKTEIADPSDPRSVRCACGAVFDAREAPFTYWIGAGLLCALVLVALWITAWQNRDRKLAARYGEEPAPPAARPVLAVPETGSLASLFEGVRSGEDVDVDLAAPSRQRELLDEAAKRGVAVRFLAGQGRPLRLALDRGRPLRVEHFAVKYAGKSLSVSRAQGPELVRFERLGRGQVRRWHELELSLLEVHPETVTAEILLKPGSPCFGAGRYLLLRPGLRVELPEGRAASVVAWDPVKRELTLRLESGGAREERTLAMDAEGQAFGIACRLLSEEDGSPALTLRFD
jgi:hypothetical protein